MELRSRRVSNINMDGDSNAVSVSENEQEEINITDMLSKIFNQLKKGEQKMDDYSEKMLLQQQEIGAIKFHNLDIQSKVSKILEETKEEYQILSEEVKKNKADIDNLKNSLGDLKVQVESTPNTMITGMAPIICQPPNNAIQKFNGQLRSVHPVDFFNSLENYLLNVKLTEKHKMNTSFEMLEGNAKIWANVNKAKWQKFDEFKDAFLKKYWSEEIQDKIRSGLFMQRSYNPRFGKYTDHAWYWINRTIHLTPAIGEGQLVRSIAKHFSKDIETILITARVKTIDELIDVLENLEDLNRPQKQHSFKEQDGFQNRKQVSSLYIVDEQQQQPEKLPGLRPSRVEAGSEDEIWIQEN